MTEYPGSMEPSSERTFVDDQPGGSRQDNWGPLGRSRMICESCRFYVPRRSKDEGTLTAGRCRRRAPTMDGFPVVWYDDWCGDHKLADPK